MPHSTTTPEEKVKMLVLETDEPHPDTKDNRGSFGDIFSQLFKKAGDTHDPPLGIDVDMHYVVDDEKNGHHGHVPKATEIPADTTALLLTGSMYDAHGDDEWITSLASLIEELWRTRPEMKFSGVCFGHQLLNRVLGAKIEPTPGGRWELSHTSMKLTAVGQKLFRTKDEKLAVHQMHQDQVTTVPSPETTELIRPDTSVHVWASTEHTKIQGIYIRNRLFTSQGHLGFDEKMVKRQIELRQQSGAISEDNAEEVTEAEEKAHLEHDGEVVASAILRFFHGEDADID